MNRKNPMKRLFVGTLRRQLIVGVALVHAALISLFIIDLVGRQEKMILENQARQAQTLARSLATSSAGWIVANDIAGLQELVDAQRNYPDLIFSVLTDAYGHVLADTDTRKVGFAILDLPSNPTLTVISKSEKLVDVAVPAMLSGVHVGWARVGIGQKTVHEKLSKIIRDGIIYAIFAIVIGSVLAWFMGRRITIRLDSIGDTIDAVKTGNRGLRTRLDGGDEAAFLAEEFNIMLDAIDAQEAELKRINANLEKQVDERTQQLRSTLAMVKKNELELKMAQKVARVGSWALDLRDNTLDWSDTACAICGIDGTTPPSIDAFVPLIHPDDKAMVDSKWSAALSGEEFSVEHRIVTREGVKWVHERAEFILDENGKPISGIGTIADITERKKTEEERETLIAELKDALENIKTLKGLLPICASCKKIRVDSGYWEQIEVYVHEHSEAQFSHGICPDCMKKLYPDYC